MWCIRVKCPHSSGWTAKCQELSHEIRKPLTGNTDTKAPMTKLNNTIPNRQRPNIRPTEQTSSSSDDPPNVTLWRLWRSEKKPSQASRTRVGMETMHDSSEGPFPVTSIKLAKRMPWNARRHFVSARAGLHLQEVNSWTDRYLFNLSPTPIKLFICVYK